MEQPEEFIEENSVCYLKKSLYGLKQAARCWNHTLVEHLKSNGYVQNPAESCIYIKKNETTGEGKFVILAIYVDDIIPISNNLQML